MKNLSIPIGGMYQQWSYLMDLVEEETAKTLEQLANTKGWREVQDDNYLVCLHKGDLVMN